MAIITTEDEQHLITLTDTCVEGDAIAFDGTNWVKADAVATIPLRAEFFALRPVAAVGGQVRVAKRIRIQDTGAFTKGALLFLSGTAGKYTATNPVAALALVQVIGRAISADEAVFDADIPHLTVPFSLVSTLPATAANYGSIFVADQPWRLVAAREAHAVAGSDGGAVTLDIEKLLNGEALDSGVSMIASTFSLKATADTEAARGPHSTVSQTRLKPGDRVALKDGGTLTAVAGLSGSLTFVRDL